MESNHYCDLFNLKREGDRNSITYQSGGYPDEFECHRSDAWILTSFASCARCKLSVDCMDIGMNMKQDRSPTAEGVEQRSQEVSVMSWCPQRTPREKEKSLPILFVKNCHLVLHFPKHFCKSKSWSLSFLLEQGMWWVVLLCQFTNYSFT
jgi:hypothetical protein